MSTREEVYRAIDSERAYQDLLREAGRFEEEVLSVAGEIACIKTYLDQAFVAYANNPGETPQECLHTLRKIGAMCVRALEHHGAPFRA